MMWNRFSLLLLCSPFAAFVQSFSIAGPNSRSTSALSATPRESVFGLFAAGKDPDDVRRTVSLTELMSNDDASPEEKPSRTFSLTQLMSDAKDDVEEKISTLPKTQSGKIDTNLVVAETTNAVKNIDMNQVVAETTKAIKNVNWEELFERVTVEAKEVWKCANIAADGLLQPKVTPEDIVRVCDEIDEVDVNPDVFVSNTLDLRRRSLEFKRYELLAKLLRTDYDAYVATASFVSPSRVPRAQLPNVQDVPVDKNALPATRTVEEEGIQLVPDCELEDKKFQDNPLDTLLLGIFRKLVAKNTGGITSEKKGIEGLLEQGRTFMLKPGQTPEAQHKMVYDTLGGLMTPALPPFYRIFMSGIVPKVGSEWDGKQIGPWFYAPFLTSFVTPTFFAFLVGPSTPNRRKDGQPGGLLVEKCKFLQESGCKGLCLNQCKLPAQQFFQEELGLPLTVSPNFATQECQWSFGEVPLPPEEDPSFPTGCLVGCQSRKALAGTNDNLCL